MPTDLNNIVYYAIALVFVIVLIFIGARVLRGLTSSGNAKAGGFLRGRDRRLGVVEAASVDGRRKLILLRRDDVEHLIMTGGPVDVVIETGINTPQPQEPTFESSPRESTTSRDKQDEKADRDDRDDRRAIFADEDTESPASDDEQDR